MDGWMHVPLSNDHILVTVEPLLHYHDISNWINDKVPCLSSLCGQAGKDECCCDFCILELPKLPGYLTQW